LDSLELDFKEISYLVLFTLKKNILVKTNILSSTFRIYILPLDDFTLMIGLPFSLATKGWMTENKAPTPPTNQSTI